MKKRILTGITTTGTPHIGNYIGAIRPAIELSLNNEESFFFLADYHSIIKNQNSKLIQDSVRDVALAWLSCGLDPNKTYFYKQSDVPEILELTWILNCVTAKGLMNRAHAYKAATSINETDLDKALNENLIFGAGIDVFEKEPPDDNNPLLKNEKVFLSPHTAAFTEECMTRMGIETIQNIIDFFENKIDQSKIVKL